MLLTTILLYLTLLVCGILIALVVIRYDLYEREPAFMLLIVTLVGAAAMWTTGKLQVAFIEYLVSQRHAINDTELALLAGTTEELAKFLVVFAVFLCVRRWFNDPLDGLIYGSFAGLGCAFEESVALLLRTRPMLLPPQEPIRLAGHLIMGGIGSFGLGVLIRRTRFASAAVIGAFLAAVLLHVSWDVVAFAADDHYRINGRIATWHTILPIVMMLAGMVVYRRLADLGAGLTLTHLQICDLKRHRGPRE